MAKQLYDYWFVQFEFPNEEGKSYKSNGGIMRYDTSLKHEIPERWNYVPLSELVSLLDSKRVPLSQYQREQRKGIYPYYGATSVMDYIDDYIFDEDLVLLAEDGSTSDSEGHPVVQYVWGKVWVNNHAHIIKPKAFESMVFLYFLLKQIPAKKIESGSIQKKISQENMLKFKVLIPNTNVIEAFNERVMPLWEEKKQLEEQISNLEKLRNELLPLLMNGQVSIMQLNSDLFVSYIIENTYIKRQ